MNLINPHQIEKIMSFHLHIGIFFNRSPVEDLTLEFNEREILILSAINGRGKTTIISHIVDALHEFSRPHFQGAYEGKENKLYRVSSMLEQLAPGKPSIVYLRFKLPNGENADYLNLIGPCTEEEYNSIVRLENKIDYARVAQSLSPSAPFVKLVSPNITKETATNVFENNLATYFPSYRFENPIYLTDPYRVQLQFSTEPMYAGHLPNPIEVISGLPQLANWIMDLVLDMRTYERDRSQVLYNNLCHVLTLAFISKNLGRLRFGIGPRGNGALRIQIMGTQTERNTIYPSIFGISAGESALLCLFGEILRQADKNQNNVALQEIKGIVLIDEIDKHLHIKLQKEVLPHLLDLFPNVQFIVSSHSPFLSMGLAEIPQNRTKIVDLETFGISRDPTTNDLYKEVYQMMLTDNERFKEAYIALTEKVRSGEKPLLITEGKTDVCHLKAAQNKLNLSALDIDYFDAPAHWGDSKLKLLLEQLSKVPQARTIIGMFDRDCAEIVKEIDGSPDGYKYYGNNVYGFCIPVPPGRERYENISIEFYYRDEDIRRENDGKRLHFDNEVEFRQSASKKGQRRLVKLDTPKPEEEYTKKIFDENVSEMDTMHSKSTFANLILNNDEFSRGIDFESFRLIFTKIAGIIPTMQQLVD